MGCPGLGDSRPTLSALEQQEVMGTRGNQTIKKTYSLDHKVYHCLLFGPGLSSRSLRGPKLSLAPRPGSQTHLSPIDRAIDPGYFCVFLQQLHQSQCFPSRARSEQANHFQTTSRARERTLWLSVLWKMKAGVTVADHRPAHPQLPAYPSVTKLPSSSVDAHCPPPSSSPSPPALMRPSSPFRIGHVLSCACKAPQSHSTSPKQLHSQLQLAPIVNQFSLLGGLCIIFISLLSTPPYTDL